MKIVRKINNELAIAGQITLEQLPQIAQEGFKSVLNLRSPNEQGFLNSEPEKVEFLGLSYINIPVKSEVMNDETATSLLEQINKLSKPLLMHCDYAMRSAVIVLMYIVIWQGATLQQAFKQVEKFGLFRTVSD
ncbi:beta-lactamase hydrolase domain-containing protein [Halotia branconii]|uniref:Sulfur transferase domain-containing protein n=1 Tax=Halotia branconii CENA392 TaxID=1539056 RepID=A0AAJ6NSC6_9CYAN|nr:sulfur transferase domain-containing protein [Halotia branconii]WGV25658.1 sulfur transferase domain-containing protein [Halotia branconii CENA392]